MQTLTTPVPPVTVVQDTSILERNLAALARTSPRTVELIRAAAPAPLAFLDTDEGVPGATLAGIALASRRRPLDEGRVLAATIPIEQAAAVVVLGFALGYHARALAERMGRTGIVLVFEPDIPLLRAVLERIDHSAWLLAANVTILTDPADAAAISDTLRGVEAIVALGVRFLDHPPSRARLGAQAEAFSARFAEVVRAIRTTVVTTLVQAEVTLRNLLMNVDRYATVPGIADLAGAAAGRTAVVVAAGPSLERNIDLLARPGVRDRVVIIAVQTVLKPLLARGIRPHFVTALDYHEISRRFYEGLTPADVEGVTLVAEPKANPAILDAFPGAIRCPEDAFLDSLLGPGLARPMGPLKAGATVAHMAYYLARHLGCDPVVLVGQDLGFTDGQYYAARAAIHDVWGPELNAFNTLEMMEWQRIVRARSILRPAQDTLGRPVYTDEQMHTYLVQFERDFLADAEAGRAVIDATEGGVLKRHTQVRTLAEALDAAAPAAPLTLPEPATARDAQRLRRVADRVRSVRADVRKVADHCRSAGELLAEMRDHQQDQARVNGLIARTGEVRRRVSALDPAFSLVQQLNQTGVLKRVRADRRLGLEEGLTALERQRRQIERDIMNVGWLADAADQLGSMLDDALRALGGAPKITRDPPPPELAGDEPAPETPNAQPRARRAVALIPLDPARSGMGTARSLAEPFLCGLNPLRMTLARLARCKRLDGALILADDPAAARALAGDPPPGLRLDFARPAAPLDARAAAVRAARLWSPTCWRGGLASFTCYDELLAPTPMLAAMEEHGIDGAVLVGADWALVDPEIIDRTIDAYHERRWTQGGGRPLPAVTFSQAPPGLGACVVDRRLMKDLAALEAQRPTPIASIGAMLGYLPAAPASDPIAKPVCVGIDAELRSLQVRCVPDSQPRRLTLTAALGRHGEAVLTMPARQIAALIREHDAGLPAGPLAPVPQQLVLELCTGRRTGGRRARWLDADASPIERPPLDPALADRLFHELGEARTDAAVTFAGAGDPLLHPEWKRLVRYAKRAGIAAVHIRTDLLCQADELDALLDSGVDVISVDLMADTAATYRAIMGVDLFNKARANLEHLLNRRAQRSAGPLPTPWIVPRITRCDAAYGELESFYDRWLVLAGAAAIDPLPLPGAGAGERIRPLPKPAAAVRRAFRLRMLVHADGRVPAGESDLRGERTIGTIGGGAHGPAGREPLAVVWRRLCTYRQGLYRQHGPDHPDLWTGQ